MNPHDPFIDAMWLAANHGDPGARYYDAPAIDWMNFLYLARAFETQAPHERLSNAELRIVLRAMNAIGNIELARVDDYAADLAFQDTLTRERWIIR